MTLVGAQEFAKALEQMGVSLPKTCSRATILLKAGAPVLIECEMLVERDEDMTTLRYSAARWTTTGLKVTRLYRLVEDEKCARPADFGASLRNT